MSGNKITKSISVLEEIEAQILDLAKKEKRSFNQQVMTLVDEALEARAAREAAKNGV